MARSPRDKAIPPQFGIEVLTSAVALGDQMTKNSQSTHLLRLPLSVKAEVERFAKADGVSINQFVATAVAEKLAAMHTAAFCRAMAIDAGHSRIL